MGVGFSVSGLPVPTGCEVRLCGETCCFHEIASKPFSETPYTRGFPVKPIILGKIIGFGLNDFNGTGSPYSGVSSGSSGSGL